MQDSSADLDRLGDEIAELSAHLDAATARLLDLIREFDAREGWNTGFRSCAAWLSWRVGLDLGAARERVRVARALGTLPRLAQALARGELSYAKVRALTRVATPETEERLLAVGRAGTADHVERIVRGWRRMDRKAEAAETAPTTREPGAARVSRRGRYGDDPRATRARGRRAARAGARRGARGVVSADAPAGRGRGLRGRFRGNAHDGPAAGRRAGVGGRDSAAPRDRSGCSRRALSGRGPRRRSGPRGCRCARPVRARGRHTRFRGNVPAPGVRCQPRGHAARPGRPRRRSRGADPDDSAGDQTSAASSRPRLSLSRMRNSLWSRAPHPSLGPGRAHHALESRSTVSPASPRCARRGLSGRSAARRRAAIPTTGRTGSTGSPESPEVQGDPVRLLRARHEEEGLNLHAGTTMPGWLGERLDVGWAIDVLHPLARDLR